MVHGAAYVGLVGLGAKARLMYALQQPDYVLLAKEALAVPRLTLLDSHFFPTAPRKAKRTNSISVHDVHYRLLTQISYSK